MTIKDIDTTLTTDDIKIYNHLLAVNRLFRNGNLTVTQLFVDNGTLCLTKRYNNQEYVIKSFTDIMCDGGDPDRCGEFGIADELEWLAMMLDEN